MASYATYADVKARAGRFAAAFEQAGKHPDQNDITALIADVSSEIDSTLIARGFDPASLDATVVAGFKDLTAYGALARALGGLPGTPTDLIAAATQVWVDGLRAIEEGNFPALQELLAGVAGDTSGSFWTDEPDYGMRLATNDLLRRGLNPDMAPAVARTQSL